MFRTKRTLEYLFIVTLLLMSVTFVSIPVVAQEPNESTQLVVDYLEKNFGFDVTFAYYGSNESLTYGTENCALVVMRTDESIINFQFTDTHEAQFREGKITLQIAFPDAEVFIVFIFEDLDGGGIPDKDNGYYEISGGVYGGRMETAFPGDYWMYADSFIRMGETVPPSVSIASPSSGNFINSSDVTVSWSGSDESGICCYLVYIEGYGGVILVEYEGWINVGPTTSYAYENLADGSYEACVRAVDISGNMKENSVKFSVATGDSLTAEPLPDNYIKVQIFWSGYTMTVITNSTCLGAAFDSTSRQLFAKVSGPDGTTGECDITVPKNLVSSSSDIHVYLDDQPIEFTLTGDGTYYYIHMEYAHSEHDLAVGLGAAGPTPPSAPPLIWAVVFLVIIGGLGFLVYRRITRAQNN